MRPRRAPPPKRPKVDRCSEPEIHSSPCATEQHSAAPPAGVPSIPPLKKPNGSKKDVYPRASTVSRVEHIRMSAHAEEGDGPTAAAKWQVRGNFPAQGGADICVSSLSIRPQEIVEYREKLRGIDSPNKATARSLPGSGQLALKRTTTKSASLCPTATILPSGWRATACTRSSRPWKSKLATPPRPKVSSKNPSAP